MGQAKRRGSFEERARQSRAERKDSFIRAWIRSTGYREMTKVPGYIQRIRDKALERYPIPYSSELRTRYIEQLITEFVRAAGRRSVTNGRS